MRDLAAADPLEALAREKGVTYVKLDGEVGVLEWRRLTMSTVDVVTFVGGRSANFWISAEAETRRGSSTRSR